GDVPGRLIDGDGRIELAAGVLGGVAQVVDLLVTLPRRPAVVGVDHVNVEVLVLQSVRVLGIVVDQVEAAVPPFVDFAAQCHGRLGLQRDRAAGLGVNGDL